MPRRGDSRLGCAPEEERADTSGRAGGLKRQIAFGVVAVVVLGIAAYLLWPAVRPGELAPAGVITVNLTMAGFNPNYIEARAGEPLTLRLVNRDSSFHPDGGWHQFAIDELQVDVNVPAGTTQDFSFTPAVEGTYRFYCSVCCGGQANPAMWGTLEVTA